MKIEYVILGDLTCKVEYYINPLKGDRTTPEYDTFKLVSVFYENEDITDYFTNKYYAGLFLMWKEDIDFTPQQNAAFEWDCDFDKIEEAAIDKLCEYVYDMNDYNEYD